MPPERPPGPNTFSRIATGRRLPQEYEIVSSDLHYNYPHRFELAGDNSVIDWYYRHREGSLFQAENWESFADPRLTTYHRYNEIQDRKEDVIDGLLREIDETGYDGHLAEEWVAFLDQSYAPLRFPAHGLQMLAAYIAQLAPASRITNCAAFQAADEMRRVQRIAHRTAQLAAHRSGIDIAGHRHTWEEADEFQAMRRMMECALVTYDWGEAFVVTNIVIKPLIDHLINEEIAGSLAAANGDPILKNIHFSLNEDSRWHLKWTAALLEVAMRDTPANREQVWRWTTKWRPIALDAVEGLAAAAAHAPIPLDPAAMTARSAAAN